VGKRDGKDDGGGVGGSVKIDKGSTDGTSVVTMVGDSEK
jgi:hypothetical protein